MSGRKKLPQTLSNQQKISIAWSQEDECVLSILKSAARL